MDGKNIFDFVDADILQRLEELENEEAMIGDVDIDEEMPEEERLLLAARRVQSLHPNIRKSNRNVLSSKRPINSEPTTRSTCTTQPKESSNPHSKRRESILISWMRDSNDCNRNTRGDHFRSVVWLQRWRKKNSKGRWLTRRYSADATYRNASRTNSTASNVVDLRDNLKNN